MHVCGARLCLKDDNIAEALKTQRAYFFYMPKENMVIAYPLVNFESDVDEIPLSKHLLIKKCITVIPPFEISGIGVTPKSSSTRWGAQIKGSSFHDIEKRAIVLIYGLRLFKTGPVGFDDYYFESELSPPNLSVDKIPDLWYLKPELEVSGTFDLRKTEVEHVKKFFGRFLSIRSVGRHLQMALRRFNNGIQKASLEEKFLDFVIALEILFLSNGPGAMRYKLANRVASLLGKEDSFQIYKDVTELYIIRNEILHQGKTSYKKLTQKEPYSSHL